MTAYRKISGTWRTVLRTHRNIGGVWKPVSMWRNIGGVWKRITAIQQLTAAPNPAVAHGSAAVTSITALISATYSFTLLSGSSTGVVFGSGSGTSTSITLNIGGGASGSRDAAYRVTDTLTGSFVDVSLTVDWGV